MTPDIKPLTDALNQSKLFETFTAKERVRLKTLRDEAVAQLVKTYTPYAVEAATLEGIKPGAKVVLVHANGKLYHPNRFSVEKVEVWYPGQYDAYGPSNPMRASCLKGQPFTFAVFNDLGINWPIEYLIP